MNQDLLIKLEKAAEKLVLDIPAPLDCPEYTALFNEKFAELLIRECIEVCKSRVGNSDYNTGRMHCVSDLKEHFGVEE